MEVKKQLSIKNQKVFDQQTNDLKYMGRTMGRQWQPEGDQDIEDYAKAMFPDSDRGMYGNDSSDYQQEAKSKSYTVIDVKAGNIASTFPAQARVMAKLIRTEELNQAKELSDEQERRKQDEDKFYN